jgi:hypothetical protein
VVIGLQSVIKSLEQASCLISNHGSLLTVFCNLFMQFMTLSWRRIDAFPPGGFTPELLAQERARVRELYAAGILRQIAAFNFRPLAISYLVPICE